MNLACIHSKGTLVEDEIPSPTWSNVSWGDLPELDYEKPWLWHAHFGHLSFDALGRWEDGKGGDGARAPTHQARW